jgi:hypothetical protein
MMKRTGICELPDERVFRIPLDEYQKLRLDLASRHDGPPTATEINRLLELGGQMFDLTFRKSASVRRPAIIRANILDQGVDLRNTIGF